MSIVGKLVELLNRSGDGFYHFTDTRNLAAIRQHGLLSTRLQAERGIKATAPGGNDWSRTADKRKGMDAYVHLCFFREHPMEWLARQDGRIIESVFLKIAPEVLLMSGVLIVDKVSNRQDAQPNNAERMISELDLKVIYTRTDWKDPQIQERLQTARKYEILIPNRIPCEFIRNMPRG